LSSSPEMPNSLSLASRSLLRVSSSIWSFLPVAFFFLELLLGVSGLAAAASLGST